LPRGRGDRAPPRKNRPPHWPRVFPREAILARITNPAEGRAPHARKEGTGLTVAYPRWAAAPSPTHRVGMKCLGIRTVLPRGRTECVPPRKPPFAPFPGLPPQGHLALDGPPPRRGGLRTPGKEGFTPSTTLPPFGHRLILKPPAGVKCLGIRTAILRGRGDRVPPRKSLLASFPGLSR